MVVYRRDREQVHAVGLAVDRDAPVPDLLGGRRMDREGVGTVGLAAGGIVPVLGPVLGRHSSEND